MKKTTLKKIASIAGVSQATVSLVLNSKVGVGDTKREKIKAILEENGYQIKTEQRLLFLKFRLHGKLVEENRGLITSIYKVIEEQCKKRNYHLELVTCDDNLQQTLDNLDFLRYTGIIVLGTELPLHHYSLLEKIDIPFVVLDNNMIGYDYHCIGINNQLSVDTALSLSDHTKIVHIKSSLWSANFEERAKAVQKIAKNSGITVQTIATEPTLMKAFESVREKLETINYPCFVFADNDIIALGAAKAFQDAGYRIPADCSIVGFDDISLAQISMPALTTVRINKQLIGRMTVDMLLKRIEDKGYTNMKTLIAGTLIQRDSTKQRSSSK